MTNKKKLNGLKFEKNKEKQLNEILVDESTKFLKNAEVEL